MLPATAHAAPLIGQSDKPTAHLASLRAKFITVSCTVFIVLGLTVFALAFILQYTPPWLEWCRLDHCDDRLFNAQWVLASAALTLSATSAVMMELFSGRFNYGSRLLTLRLRLPFVGAVITPFDTLWYTLLIAVVLWWGPGRAYQFLAPLMPQVPEVDRIDVILNICSLRAGYAALIPISLLGVPLSRSSALWRCAGLSYEEAIAFHRTLGVLTMALLSLHLLGYLVLWFRQGGWQSIFSELFGKRGIAGLDPTCDAVESPGLCEHVSNLAGLIGWAAGLLIWLTSIGWIRRSHYLRFIQFHQLHYVFFAF